MLFRSLSLRVHKDPSERRLSVDRTDKVGETSLHVNETAFFFGRFVQRACVDAMPGGYERDASSCEKSISLSASSIRRV